MLLLQLEDYSRHRPMLDLTLKRAGRLTAGEREEDANWHNQIFPHPNRT